MAVDWICPNCDHTQPDAMEGRGDFRCDCGFLEIWGKADRDRRRRPYNPRSADRVNPDVAAAAAICANCPAGELMTDGRGDYCGQSGRSIATTATAGCPLGVWGPRRILHFVGKAGNKETTRRICWTVTESTDMSELQEAIADTSPAVVAALDGLIAGEIWERLKAQNPWTRFLLLPDLSKPPAPVPLDAPLERLLTIGVTTHKRPEDLARCVASIRSRYPALTLDVIDTFGNLSKARNMLVDRCRTPFFCLVEDDMEFDQTTDVAKLLRCTAGDDEIGGCGALLVEPDQASRGWCHEFRAFRGRLEMIPSRQPARITDRGDVYWPCDAVSNFGVFRTESLRAVRWDESLELCEHREFFWRYSQAWRSAVCAEVSILHHRSRPSEAYIADRRRPEFGPLAAAKIGFEMSLREEWQPPRYARPNVVVLGVGHSNTTITTQQLAAMGWQVGDVDGYAEPVELRELTREHIRGADFDMVAARELIAELPQPWVVKVPGFARTLERWLPAFAPYTPFLLWVRKDLQRVKQSYRTRGHSPACVEGLFAQCRERFGIWPWAKLAVDAEDIAAAVSLFDGDRSAGRASLYG